MKRLGMMLCMTMFGFATTGFAGTYKITDYQQLVNAVEQGKDVKAIIHFDHCREKNALKSNMPQTGSTTRINFNVYSHHKVKVDGEIKEAVATSMTMQIEHPGLGFQNTYARLRIFADNTADFHAAYYDPLTNKQTFAKDWVCPISAENEQRGISLYGMVE